jgi:peptidoglycan/LPS O-acetylase OafA/YrhL
MSRPDIVRLEQNPQFPALDTLRAVGAFAVLTTHVTFQTGDYFGHGVWGTVMARLDIGVAIFFVLSGFLLGRPYLARAMTHLEAPPIGRYYWKRFLRIYPVYVVTVIIALALLPDNSTLQARDWVRTLLLADTFAARHLPHGLTQMWSLSVEASFYLVLPLLMIAALGRAPGLRPRRVSVLLVALTAFSVSWHLGLATWVAGVSLGAPLLWLPAFLTWFSVGIALALVHVLHQTTPEPGAVLRTVTTLGSMPGACWAMAAGLLLVAATPVGGPTQLIAATQGESAAKHLLYAGIGGLVVLPGLFAAPRSRYSRVMSFGALRHLGHISYSIFCIHLPLLTLAMWLTGSTLFEASALQVWAVTVALTLPAAELLYRLVEKPGMRLKDRGRRRPISADHPRAAAQTTTTR